MKRIIYKFSCHNSLRRTFKYAFIILTVLYFSLVSGVRELSYASPNYPLHKNLAVKKKTNYTIKSIKYLSKSTRKQVRNNTIYVSSELSVGQKNDKQIIFVILLTLFGGLIFFWSYSEKGVQAKDDKEEQEDKEENQ